MLLAPQMFSRGGKIWLKEYSILVLTRICIFTITLVNCISSIMYNIMLEQFKDQHCGGEFYVAIWLDHGTQTFGQTVESQYFCEGVF